MKIVKSNCPVPEVKTRDFQFGGKKDWFAQDIARLAKRRKKKAA